MAVEIYPVNRELVDEVWSELSKPIDNAMRYHEAMDAEDLKHLVLTGRVWMFAAIVENQLLGALFVEILDFPSSRILNVIGTAGKRGQTRVWFREAEKAIEDLARQYGCTRMIAIGRRGWLMAKRYGWKAEPRSILTKELNDGQRRRINGTESGPLERGTALPEVELSGRTGGSQ